MDRYYNVHNIVKFKIADKSNFFHRLMVNTPIAQYENFEADWVSEDEIGIIFELDDFIPSVQRCYVVGDGKYYCDLDYMYVPKETYKSAKWKFEINGINGGKTVVRIACNFLGRIFIVGNVIDFLLHLKLMEKSYPLIHASAVAKNAEGVIISARGGGGKTALALALAERGCSYLGDNYTIIHDGDILSFPTPTSVFTYNLAPIIKQEMSRKEKATLSAKNLLYWTTRGYAKFFTKINPKRFFGNIDKTPNKLHALFILVPYENDSDNRVRIRRMTQCEAVEKLVANQKLEFTSFNKYIDEYSYFFPQSNFASHWNLYAQCLTENLKECSAFFEILAPPNYDEMAFIKILREIEYETGLKL